MRGRQGGHDVRSLSAVLSRRGSACRPPWSPRARTWLRR